MYIIVVGSGNSGSHLANILSEKGEEVVVIDKDERNFNKLSPSFSGFNFSGDATNINVLKQAKIEQADLVVVTTGYDIVNSMVAQTAKYIFEVPKVMVRVIDTEKISFYDNMPVEIFSPINMLVDKLIENIYADEGNKQ